MRLRFGTLLFALAGLPALFFLATLGCYGLAFLAERLWSGAGPLANVLSLMVVMVMTFAALLTVTERKWSAAIQDRMGPNRANLGPFRTGGLPQVIADGLKALFKEDFIPDGASKRLFRLAPALAFAPAVALFAVVPVAPRIDFFGTGTHVSLQVADPDFGILFVFALASLAVYGTVLAGWSANNKLGLLGAVRAASQMLSYEVALGLSVVGAMIAFSTLRLSSMAEAQSSWLWGGSAFGLPAWGALLQPVGLVLFLAAAFAETKRIPFDLPEGDSEIVGYFVEYSGMRFGVFMISEYVEIVVLSAVTATVFFGGWHLPFGEAFLSEQLGTTWLACLQGTAFWMKVLVLCWLQLAIRWTVPRFRYDQVQRLGWRMLLPLSLVNVFATAGLVLLDPSLRMLAGLGILEIAALAALTLFKPRPAKAIQLAP